MSEHVNEDLEAGHAEDTYYFTIILEGSGISEADAWAKLLSRIADAPGETIDSYQSAVLAIDDDWPEGNDPDWIQWMLEAGNGDTRLGFSEWREHKRECESDDALSDAKADEEPDRIFNAERKVTKEYSAQGKAVFHEGEFVGFQTVNYIIESRDAGSQTWEEWRDDTDAAQLLREFVNAVSEEHIDDVNRYWRVREEEEEEKEKVWPEIIWSKPLTSNEAKCGPESDPAARLLGTVYIAGVPFHAEAWEVMDDEEGVQVGKEDESDTYLAELLEIVQGSAHTITIGGREYVLAITPFQR